MIAARICIPNHAIPFRGRQKFRTISMFQNPPWQIIKVTENRTEYSGLVFDIIKELSRILNFTYTVNLVKVGLGANQLKFSRNNTEKDISGDITTLVTNSIPEAIIDMVTTKSVAIAACGFTVTEKEKLYINFTVPVSTQTYTFLAARPRELSRALLFMSPFTKDVSNF